MRLNACQSLSVSLAGIVPIARGFLCFLTSVVVFDMAALEKPGSSAVLVTEAPAIRTPSIRPSSNSLRSRILT